MLSMRQQLQPAVRRVAAGASDGRIRRQTAVMRLVFHSDCGSKKGFFKTFRSTFFMCPMQNQWHQLQWWYNLLPWLPTTATGEPASWQQRGLRAANRLIPPLLIHTSAAPRDKTQGWRWRWRRWWRWLDTQRGWFASSGDYKCSTGNMSECQCIS